jgi:hypothetical protein
VRTNCGRTFWSGAPEPGLIGLLRYCFFSGTLIALRNGIGRRHSVAALKQLFYDQESTKENDYGLFDAFGICDEDGGCR